MTTNPDVVIDRITLIVSDLDRAEEDYVKTFGCSVEQRADIEPSLTSVLCIRRARGRRSLLRLGRERIELLEFTDSAGRPYPPDSTSTDLWFQHMAIIVNDMTRAHQRVMANRRFRPISRHGPVRLPDSSGGVTAFKFRDRDGHPHSIDFWLTSEDLPLAESRVTLRPDGAIRLALQPGNNTEGLTRLRTTFQGMLSKLGMVDTTFVRSLYLHKAFDAAATAHQAGTARFGTDPAASVLDVHCKAHDLDNLRVEAAASSHQSVRSTPP